MQETLTLTHISNLWGDWYLREQELSEAYNIIIISDILFLQNYVKIVFFSFF